MTNHARDGTNVTLEGPARPSVTNHARNGTNVTLEGPARPSVTFYPLPARDLPPPREPRQRRPWPRTNATKPSRAAGCGVNLHGVNLHAGRTSRRCP